MASNWYHSFEAQMSWEVVGVVIVLMALAYLIGRKSIQYVSVKKACKIKGEFVAPKSAPQYEAGKENGVDRRIKDRVLKVASRKELKANSTVMVLHSTTFDNAIAAVFASIFAYVFANAHINGMIQWFINHLGANESAAWGDICAFMAIGLLFSVFYAIIFRLVRAGQIHTVVEKSEDYLAAGYAPLYFEKESVGYGVQLIVWLYRRKQQKKEAAKARRAHDNVIQFPETEIA